MTAIPTTPGGHDALLRIEQLSVAFRLGDGTMLHAVRDVSFDVPADATVALVGESGSGKSVTATAVMGLHPQDGTVIGTGSRIVFRGRDLLTLPRDGWRALRAREIAMIFQDPMSSLNPVFPVGDQIAETLRHHVGLSRAAAAARAVELLDEVGLPEPARRARAYPHELSGGQQQRVMIAMAVACEPSLLIADEPTTALDVTVQRQILGLLRDLRQRRRMSVLFISHDLALCGEVADRVVVMRDGMVREEGPVEQVFGAPRNAYTRALLECRPQLDAGVPARLPVMDASDAVAARAVPAARAEVPAAGAAEVVLEARSVSKVFTLREGLFRRREFRAVQGVSFTLRRGRTLGIVGESGSGKSTLAYTLLRLHRASGGEAWFDGRDMLALDQAAFFPYKQRLQIVFQNPYAALNPRFTVAETLQEPLRIHGRAQRAEALRQARLMLDQVGLPRSALDRYPHEFSGGQRQRIAIARCLVLHPEVLICDEAVSALDVSVQAQVLNLLRDLQDEFGLSYLFISHDLAVTRFMSDELLVMRDGEVVEQGPSEEVYRAPRDEYTKALLAAVARGFGGTAAAARDG